jgi:hypothetical protein
VVECHLAKVDVEGSNPFSRSTFFVRSHVWQLVGLAGWTPVPDGRWAAPQSRVRDANWRGPAYSPGAALVGFNPAQRLVGCEFEFRHFTLGQRANARQER